MEVREYCETILFGRSLEEKLILATDVVDNDPIYVGALPSVPARQKNIAISSDHRKKSPFPRVADMESSSVRGKVFHFFANHELLALELMALALLKFPHSPKSFRLGIMGTMQEEQHHLRLYLERMNALGVGFGDLSVNNFFWHCLKDMSTPLDYTVGMSMTFEQANLDYCRFYMSLFKELGDDSSEKVLRQVYLDEIGHVKHGVHWFDQLRSPEKSQWETYKSLLRLPLTPRRAKGRYFDKAARKEAGLSFDYINELELYQDRHNKSSILYIMNTDCEHSASRDSTHTSVKQMNEIIADLELLPMVFAKGGDKILCHTIPSQEFIQNAGLVGFSIPQFSLKEDPDLLEGVKEVRPWGWSHQVMELDSLLRSSGDIKSKAKKEFKFFDKSLQIMMRRELEAFETDLLGTQKISWEGSLVTDLSGAVELVSRYQKCYNLPTVFKKAYGSAGRGMLRVKEGQFTKEQKLWLEKQFRSIGYVIAEPWFASRDLDLSVLLNVGAKDVKVKVARFFCSSLGQYRGHVIGQPSGLLSADRCRLLYQKNIVRYLETVGRYIGKMIADQGFEGRCGIDAFTFYHDGQYLIRPFGELNARLTMGHFSQKLSKRVSKSCDAIFLMLTNKDLANFGVQSFRDLAKKWQQSYPIKMEGSRIRSGIYFLADPRVIKHVAPVIVVGRENIFKIKSSLVDLEQQLYLR